MPDWRDEVCSALDFWISAEGGARQAERLTCLGAARQESQRGWYSVDSRSILNADQVESLRLSGQAGPGTGPAYPVLDATQDGPVIRVRVAEFVDLADAYLWQNKHSATYLLTKLREGIANLADPGLAHDLAAGRLATAPKITRQVHGFTEMQKEACESCLSAGVRLVWGPPGTGKTRVLAEAIDALLAAGRRVLLVSSTNIAVDNALLGVINTRSRKRGDLLRVGLPHHPDVLRHPDVCLPHRVRDQLTDVDRERRAIEARLLELRQADEELARLQEETAGFDLTLYQQALELVAAEALIPDLAAAVAQASATARDRQRDANRCDGAMAAAEGSARELDAARSAYAQIDRVERELGEVAAAADELGTRALTTRHAADQLAGDLQTEEHGHALTRLRGRQRIRKLRNALETASQGADDIERRARAAEDLLARRRAAAASQVSRLAATTTASRADIAAADARLGRAQQAAAEATRAARQAEDDLGRNQQVLLAAEAGLKPTREQRAAVEDAERRQLPALAARLESVRSQIADAQPERARLQDEYSRVQERFERLRQDAEGEIIRQARLVATTLARLRTSKALMDGPYDVVLVDEAGAATLPEILLAVSRARRAAVLLGDFFQLGPVKSAVEQATRPDVQRWIHRNVFEHCGISTISDAQQSEGCTVLDVQHRFGPEIMRLANAAAYGGVLKPGDSVRAHIDDDPEIVLIDVDGLGDLATVRARTERSGGWWPAGALLSRVLADYHQARGERIGVVAPYTAQVEATLEALRDQEGAAAEATEVGTVHRFQGREFPVVVFDLVEDTGRRWMGQASAGGGRYKVNGLRLFTVAITRAQSRLYLIGSRTQISAAPHGTPLAQVARMLRARQARSVSATALITPTLLAGTGVPPLGPFSSELAEILAQHVHVADIHDERSFYDVFAGHLNSAQDSIWIWAPWTATRVRSLLPVLADAADRGVRITLFVRDPRDTLQGRQQSQQFLADLRAVLTTVVEINVMHQKIVVIDDHTVLLGSLNTLSQSWTREVMLVMKGSHFARKILEHERAIDFSSPPSCRICKSTQIDLRRRRSGEWFWQCHSPACPGVPGKTRKPWTQSIKEKPKGFFKGYRANQSLLLRTGSLDATPPTRIAFPYASVRGVAMDNTVVDIHCHMFNASDLPIRGFIKYVALHGDPVSGPLADLADWILSSGTVSYADDLARVNTLLGATGPHAVGPLKALPAGLAAPPDRIDAVATANLNMLHTQHPDLIGRVATAMAAINAGPPPPADVRPAPETAGLAPQFDVSTVLRAIRWATLFTRSRLDLAADYASVFGNAVQLVVPLMVDLGTSLGEQPPTTIAQQVELFEKISRASMLDVLPGVGGMRVHPFVSFDPLRQLNDVKTGSIRTAFDLIKLAVTDYGFIGVKVYPPMGWRPTGNTARPGLTQADANTLNVIVSDLAAWCEQEDVPLTAHCSNSNYASPGYAGMGQPSEWASLLKDYPGLHLNLGHCGGAHQNAVDYGWADAIRKAMPTYAQLYGDVGCDRIDDAATRAGYTKYLTDAAAQDPTIASRLMFGTDWYLEALNPDANQFLTEATNIATAAFPGPNAAADFRGGTALRFLGFDDPGNKNAIRLLARYNKFSAPVPRWLAQPAAPSSAQPASPGGGAA